MWREWIEDALRSAPVPDTGLVLQSTFWEPTKRISDNAIAMLVGAIDAVSYLPVRLTTGPHGLWAHVAQANDAHWVFRFSEPDIEDEYRVFRTLADADAHYVQVVRGRNDATAGAAWTATDVPGVLCGADLMLAYSVGYSYEEAAARYATDSRSAVSAWETLAGSLSDLLVGGGTR